MHLNWLCSLLAHQASSNNIYNRNCNRKNNNLVLQILVSFGGVDGDASADLHIQIYSQCRSHTLRGLVKSSLAYDVYALRSSYVLAPSILNTCRPSACGLLIFIIRACAFFSSSFCSLFLFTALTALLCLIPISSGSCFQMLAFM